MLKWFQSRLSNLSLWMAKPQPIDGVATQVKSLLQQDFSRPSTQAEVNDQVHEVILLMSREIELIRRRAKGYPAKPISACLWLSGAQYISMSNQLTAHFKSAGWIERELHASLLWTKATLAVCSHYRHMVGPAMLAHADCRERLGQNETAAQLYSAVVKDFLILLEDGVVDPQYTDQADYEAVKSLKIAADRLANMGHLTAENVNLTDLRDQAARLLGRYRLDEDAM